MNADISRYTRVRKYIHTCKDNIISYRLIVQRSDVCVTHIVYLHLSMDAEFCKDVELSSSVFGIMHVYET